MDIERYKLPFEYGVIMKTITTKDFEVINMITSLSEKAQNDILDGNFVKAKESLNLIYSGSKMVLGIL